MSATSDSPPQAALPAETLPAGWQVPRRLLLLALPIIATMLSRTVMSFVDFLFVSHLGTDAQAAIMPANFLVFCLISFGMGLVTAVNTLVSQSFGAGRRRDCGVFAWQGFYLSAIYAALLLPAWFLLPPLFRLVGHAPHVQQMEIAYSQISILSLFPSIAAASLSNFFNGIHRPSIDLWSSVIANAFNALANYALIFGRFGFPAMGFTGSALGTLLATLLQVAILLAWMLQPAYHAGFATRSTARLRLAELFQILRIGFPAGLQFTSDVFAFTFFTLFLVGDFGTAPLAANNLVFQLLQVSFLPTVGLSIAVTASVGKAIGMGRRDHARLVVRWAMLFGMFYMGSVALLFVTMPHRLAGILSPDATVQYWASHVLLLCALFQIFDALGIIHVGALRGAGDNIFTAVTAVTLGCTVFIPGGYLMAHCLPEWGILGPWTAATVHITLFGLAVAARWKWGPWEKIDLLRQDPPAA